MLSLSDLQTWGLCFFLPVWLLLDIVPSTKLLSRVQNKEPNQIEK